MWPVVRKLRYSSSICQTACHIAREGLNDILPRFLRFISLGITEMSTEMLVVLSSIIGTTTGRLCRPEYIPVRVSNFIARFV